MWEKFHVGQMPIIPNNSYWKLLDLSDLDLTVENVTTRHLLGLETINLTGEERFVEHIFAIETCKFQSETFLNLSNTSLCISSISKSFSRYVYYNFVQVTC